jgi:hypothetical protein
LLYLVVQALKKQKTFMSIIDTLKDAVGGVMGSATDVAGSIVSSALAMTDLDEKAIAMFEEKVGTGKFAEMKQMFADGKISKEEITKIATDAGVPETMIAMVVKFL